jgi:hypothetical protein
MAITYDKIATTTLSSSASSITFSSIPATFTDLKLVLTFAGTSNTFAAITFNNDTATNYSVTLMRGDGSAVAASRGTNEPNLGSQASFVPANKWGMYDFDIFSYASSLYKTVLYTKSFEANDATFNYSNKEVGTWRSTAAINRIDLTGNVAFSINTSATLYGILKA